MYTDKIKPFGALPSSRQINHFRNFGKKAFFHFGVNTFSNAEWGDGTEMESMFNPSDLDIGSWISAVKEAGFTLAILTVKHHDGFCLWPSKYTEHSVRKSPYKNGQGDVVKEFTDACHKAGIGAGVYISPWDRNSPLWGQDEYSVYFNHQLTELLSEYGRIDEVWWDGAGSSETPYDWKLWSDTVRNLQPEAVIYGSFGAADYIECRWIGNECGNAGEFHYPTINTYDVLIEDTKKLNSGVFGGERFIIAEADTSIRPGWFYHKDQDEFVKSPNQLVDLWFNSVGSSALMLLNFPPDRRGLLVDKDVESAVEAHKIVSSALMCNIAEKGHISSDSVRDDFVIENVFKDDYHLVFASSDDNINPQIEITFDTNQTFDTILIGEYVELGIRVNGFTVEAFVEGEWKLLADKKSIGYKKAVYLGKTLTDKVRIKIYGAAAAPVIREIGLYDFENAGYIRNSEYRPTGNAVDISENSSSKLEFRGDSVLMNLGGLFPFNTIVFSGCGISKYEILVFDGSKFVSVHTGINPGEEETITFDHTIYAYQYIIKCDKTIDKSINIRTYYI